MSSSSFRKKQASSASLDVSTASASTVAAAHIDAVVSDAQNMVASLTKSVKKLREEKKTLKASFDSIVEENILLKQQLADARRNAREESEDLNLQVAHAASLNSKLQERCDKLELLVKLGELKRQEQLQETNLMQKEHLMEQQRMGKLESIFQAEKRSLLAKTEAIRADNDKLRQYCSELEKEALHQWEQRCDVIKSISTLQTDHDLLKKEVSILKVLGVSQAHSKGMRSLAPLTTDKERFLLLKHELKQAADFLRHASKIAESSSNNI